PRLPVDFRRSNPLPLTPSPLRREGEHTGGVCKTSGTLASRVNMPIISAVIGGQATRLLGGMHLLALRFLSFTGSGHSPLRRAERDTACQLSAASGKALKMSRHVGRWEV